MSFYFGGGMYGGYGGYPIIMGHGGYGQQVVMLGGPQVLMLSPFEQVNIFQCKYCYEVMESHEVCTEVNTQSRANKHSSSCKRVLEFEEQKRAALAAEEEKRKQYLKAKEYAEKKAKEVEKVKNAINYYENLEY